MARSHAHPEAVALYRAILAQPDEDTPRLVYADWLDEHNQPERAEFIRLQCQLARMNEWDDGYTAARLRTERLQREHWAEWVAPPGRPQWKQRYPAGGFRAVRGFPGDVNYTSQITPAEARRWFAPHPIVVADVHVSDRYGGKAALARLASDALPHLRTLKLDIGYSCSPEGCAAACRALAAAESRSGLTRLEIAGDPTLEGLEAIITSPHLRRLEVLSVRGEGVGDEHARLMAEKMNLPALRELVLGHRGLTPAGAQALGRADWFARLHTIRLYGHDRLGDAGLTKLFARTLPELRTLHIHHCGQEKADVRLVGGRLLPGLVEVILDGDRHLNDADWAKLTGGPQELRSIDLAPLWLDGDAPAKLFDRPATRDLRQLVAGGPLSERRIAELANSPLTRSLRWLEFGGRFGTDPAALLLAGREWPHLETLSVSGGMPGASLLALIESDKFPRLMSLKTFCRDGWARFLKTLARSPAAAKFREIDLGTTMTSIAARELADSPYLGGIERLVVYKGTATPADCKRLVKRFGKRIEISGYHG